MCLTSKSLLAAAIVQLAAFGAFAQYTYQLDNGNLNGIVNASEGSETVDNWFGNEFTALPGFNVITRVDFACFTADPAIHGQVAIYRLGNPTIGPTRIYTQTFTPVSGNGSTTVNLNHISLTTPVSLDAGDVFLVSIFLPNVANIDGSHYFPYVIDNGNNSVGSFWDRSAPNSFNLDDLSGSRRLDLPITPGGFAPGPGHTVIRAIGVPEPSALALIGLGATALLIFRRRS